MIKVHEEALLQLNDYLQFLKKAYYIYNEIHYNKKIIRHIERIYKRFDKLHNKKRVFKKDIKCLKWYLESINTFDERVILSEGRKLLNGK